MIADPNRAGNATGLPYSPMRPYDEVVFLISNHIPTNPINSLSSPNTDAVNVLLHGEFPMAGVTITPFLWVKNLFDAEVIYYVYSGTGEADNTGYLDTPEGQMRVASDLGPYDNSGMKFLEKYKLAQRDPVNYGPPRQVFFGLRATF